MSDIADAGDEQEDVHVERINGLVLSVDVMMAEHGLKEQTYRASSNVTFLQLPEFVPVCARLIHLSQRNVHEIVAVDQMAVEGLAIL